MIVCVGEALVDLVAQPRGCAVRDAQAFAKVAGGAVLNVAVGIARLGGSAVFVGTLSTDEFGTFLRDVIDAEGVDGSCVFQDSHPTRLAFVARDAAGDRSFSFANAANPADARLRPGQLPVDKIRGARALHAGGGTVARAPVRAATLRACRLAREAGRFVSFDLNVRPALFASPAEMRAHLLAGVTEATLVKCSEEDLTQLRDVGVDERGLIEAGPAALVVTLGALGCRWTLGDGTSCTSPAPRAEAVDTTGAGDAFMAALLVALDRADFALTPAALDEATRTACAAGAYACTIEGAIPSLPRWNDLRSLLC